MVPAVIITGCSAAWTTTPRNRRKPLLVVICGLDKPFRTELSAADYRHVRDLGEEYLRRNPRSLPDHPPGQAVADSASGVRRIASRRLAKTRGSTVLPSSSGSVIRFLSSASSGSRTTRIPSAAVTSASVPSVGLT